jgi:hypothetical protein
VHEGHHGVEEGLVARFHNAPRFDTYSEAACRLFLTRLSATPRTDHTPPWSVMSTFCYSSHGADLDKPAAWKHRARGSMPPLSRA